MDTRKIFEINTPTAFKSLALDTFKFQYQNNKIYRDFCTHLGKNADNVESVSQIPFLPIGFFKSKKIFCGNADPEMLFESSGTTGSITSKHHIKDSSLYQQSYLRAFEHFYGPIGNYCVLALLPSYLERTGSSLVYMVNDFIARSNSAESGFYLNDIAALRKKLIALNAKKTKVLLIGVSFALLDMAENQELKLPNTIVMETGGMKGRKKEMIREELHAVLKKGFGTTRIHSEYGMTELLSQAYSQGQGVFKAPPWMKVLIRDPEDPLTLQSPNKTGGVNIIDLANLWSCSFIATQDLGKIHESGSFEILGRFDNSDIRGCNLMVL